jgi:O-antigen/teichoic acid export membrane protein
VTEPAPPSTLSRFIAGAALTGIGRSSTLIMGVLCMLIYARWLPEQEYGTFVLLQVAVVFVTGISDCGLGLTATKFIASTEDAIEKRALINTTLLFRIVIVALLAVVAFVAREPLFSVFGSSAPPEFVLFLPVLIVAEGIAAALNATMGGLFKFAGIGAIEIAVSSSSFVITAVLVIGLGSGVMGLLYARLASRLLGLALALLSMLSEHRYRLEFDLTGLWRMLRFGFPLYVSYLLDSVFTRADTVIIGILLGPAQIAFYEFARRIPDSLSMGYEAFRQVYFPFMAKLLAAGERGKVMRMLNQSNRLGAWLGCLGVLLAFGFGEPLFRVLFSERYLPSVPAFGVLMAVFMFTVIDANLGYSLVASGASDKPVIINTIRAAIIFAGYFLLIPALGILGAGMAALIGTAAVNPLHVYFLRRRDIEARMAVYVKPASVLAVCLAVQFIGAPYGYLASVGSLTLFLAGSALLSLITREDIQLGVRESRRLMSAMANRLSARRSQTA